MSERAQVVLLVDDEPRILSALRRTLRREGYDLETAENAEAALVRLEATRVDLVVSDYKMPGSNGSQLLATVRRRWPGTRRLLLSGWSREIPQSELEAAAPDGVHAKPWDERELKAQIRELLQATDGAAGGPSR
jgi:DNA-binding response OmpR family regulator